jgi:hypothetical protein
MERLNNPEQRDQTGLRGLDQKLHFIGMLNPSFPPVTKLNGLKLMQAASSRLISYSESAEAICCSPSVVKTNLKGSGCCAVQMRQKLAHAMHNRNFSNG